MTILDLLDLAVSDAGASLGYPYLKPHISLCCNTSVSWVSSLASEGPVRMPFSGLWLSGVSGRWRKVALALGAGLGGPRAGVRLGRMCMRLAGAQGCKSCQI